MWKAVLLCAVLSLSCMSPTDYSIGARIDRLEREVAKANKTLEKIAANTAPAPVVAPVVDPDKEFKEKLDAQIDAAISPSEYLRKAYRDSNELAQRQEKQRRANP